MGAKVTWRITEKHVGGMQSILFFSPYPPISCHNSVSFLHSQLNNWLSRFCIISCTHVKWSNEYFILNQVKINNLVSLLIFILVFITTTILNMVWLLKSWSGSLNYCVVLFCVLFWVSWSLSSRRNAQSSGRGVFILHIWFSSWKLDRPRWITVSIIYCCMLCLPLFSWLYLF